MKRKYLVLLLVIVTTMIPVGCSKGSSENVVLGTEKIIIDDNTKDKKNGDFQIKMVAETETENIDSGTRYHILGVHGNIVQLIYQDDCAVIKEVRVGKLDSSNKVNWTNKNVDWEAYAYSPYLGPYPTKVKKDNKVYTVNKDGELEELVAYTKLIKEQGNVLGKYTSYRNETIYVEKFGSEQEPKLAVVDIQNENYYVIPDELVSNNKYGTLGRILGIDGDRIYVSYYNNSEGTDSLINDYTIGYIENNKFTKILSEDDGIEINNTGEMLYENGRLLFSGLAEGKNGIWNYDIDNKKLTKIVDIDSDTFFFFHINENKDKVVIRSSKPALTKDEKESHNLSIANINDKLEITNITNIVTTTGDRHYKRFAGWANGGKTFYVESIIANEDHTAATNKLEVYNIVE